MGPVVTLAVRLGAYRNDGLSIVKKLGYTLRRATETGVPNLRSGEPVAHMPSAGITNFPRPQLFGLTRFKSRVPVGQLAHRR